MKTLFDMLLSVMVVMEIVKFDSSIVDAKPKAKGYAGPGPWDWQQSAPSNFPVFKPYPVNKLEQPDFMKINRNISVAIGETAYLPCRVKNLDKHTVSWVRADDVTVLSVGHLAFSSDKRISVVQVPRPRLSASDWNLSIENVTLSDDGMYECQVNTEPKINYKTFLTVKDLVKSPQADSPYYEVVDQAPADGFEQTHSVIKKHHKELDKEGFSMFLHDNGCICPKPQFKQDTSRQTNKRIEQQEIVMSIPGGSIQFIPSGHGIELECLVSGLATPPLSLYWEKGHKVVSAKERPGVSLETEKVAGVSRIGLYIGSTEISDTGNYTCVTDTDQTETVLLVVTQGNDDKSKRVPSARHTRHTSGEDKLLASVIVLGISVTSVILN